MVIENIPDLLEWFVLYIAAMAFKIVLLYGCGTLILMVFTLGAAFLWAGISGDRQAIEKWPAAVGNNSFRLAKFILSFAFKWLWVGIVALAKATGQLLQWFGRKIAGIYRWTFVD